MELAELARQNELAGGQERNLLHREMRNEAWPTCDGCGKSLLIEHTLS